MTMHIETPAARSTDSAGSHNGAQHITESGARHAQRIEVGTLIRRYPGRSTLELARLSGLDRHMIGKRAPECIAAGTAVKGEHRKCSVSGITVATWWPA